MFGEREKQKRGWKCIDCLWEASSLGYYLVEFGIKIVNILAKMLLLDVGKGQLFYLWDGKRM